MRAEDQDVSMFGYLVSDLQEDDVVLKANYLQGTIKYIDEGQLVDAWGAGNFIALKFESDDWDQFTSVKVGMEPSYGHGLVEIINDPDKDGAWKITDKDTQVFKIVATNGVQEVSKEYSLAPLTVLPAENQI